MLPVQGPRLCICRNSCCSVADHFLENIVGSLEENPAVPSASSLSMRYEICWSGLLALATEHWGGIVEIGSTKCAITVYIQGNNASIYHIKTGGYTSFCSTTICHATCSIFFWLRPLGIFWATPEIISAEYQPALSRVGAYSCWNAYTNFS
jgi:hypothetical protein